MEHEVEAAAAEEQRRQVPELVDQVSIRRRTRDTLNAF